MQLNVTKIKNDYEHICCDHEFESKAFHYSRSKIRRKVLKLTLEQLREKALFQNTIDVWIILCEEKGWNWYNTKDYRNFIAHLNSKGIKMQKFPLCIKESGGMYERGKDKTKFLDELSQLASYDSAAYTIKLSIDTLAYARSFNLK